MSWAGKILRVNLTTGEVKSEPLNMEWSTRRSSSPRPSSLSSTRSDFVDRRRCPAASRRMAV